VFVSRTIGQSLAKVLNSSALTLSMLLLVVLLAACDSSEERAEEHYESGLALMEEGDLDRALIEFRNVLQLNENHKDARLTYARIQRERGDIRDSYGQFLRVAEQYPDELEPRLALAEMALDTQNLPELERHSKAAVDLAPDNAKAQSLYNTVVYYNAVQGRDDDARTKAVEAAITLVSSNPEFSGSRKVMIDDLVRQQKWEEALAAIDAALEQTPNDESLYQLRLGLLSQLGDMSEIGTQLRAMVERFPDNEANRQMLVAFLVNQGDLDAAEDQLRSEAEASDDVEKSRRLVAFILQYRDRDAAIAELNRIIEADRLSPVVFKSTLAQLQFENGDEQEAIDALEALTAEAERSGDVREAEIDLARMYFRQNNAVEARRLVEKVLAEDPSNPAAAKLKAAWLIEDDETDDAIVLLRDALAKSPRDAGLLTLLALAHERQGNRQLMAENLSLAVEASNQAPAESLRYAQYLVRENQDIVAEGVLIDALRRDSGNIDLLSALGKVYIKMENWSQANGVVNRLEEIGTETATAVSMGLQAQALAAQDRGEELSSLLEDVANNPDTQKGGQIALFQRTLAEDGSEAALEYLETLIADAPEDGDFLFLKAGLLVLSEQTDEAKTIYTSLLERFPNSSRVWMSLYRLALLSGDGAEADKVLADGLEQIPNDSQLLFAQAERLQVNEDYEGAISVYEKLYEQNSSAIVVANNLASLLADHRDDEASLRRAYEVARRMRDTNIPALQDTYGWIAYRMGNYEESVPYLEAAAEGLAEDARVQFHYGAALAAAGQSDAAIEQLTKAKSMIDSSNPPEYIAALDAAMEQAKAPATPEQAPEQAPAETQPETSPDTPTEPAPASE
jgi:tetratricopeptide (TPR) repeat protein